MRGLSGVCSFINYAIHGLNTISVIFLLINFTFKVTKVFGSGVGWSKQVSPQPQHGHGSDLKAHRDVDSHRLRLKNRETTAS